MAAPRKFAALSEFLRGYLHQDVTAEYGSAEKALRSFRADADSTQLHRVQADWRKFQHEHQGKTLAETNAVLTGELGSSWAFAGDGELHRFSELLLQPPARTKE